jgi:hypothetical protein
MNQIPTAVLHDMPGTAQQKGCDQLRNRMAGRHASPTRAIKQNTAPA